MGTILPLMLTIFGLLIIATRGPLIFAPQKVRGIYLSIMETNKSVRFLGLFILILGVYFAMGARDEPTLAADLMYVLGLMMIVLSLFGMLLFPGIIRKFGVPIWSAFSDTALRGIGVIAVLFGLFVIAYGNGLV